MTICDDCFKNNCNVRGLVCPCPCHDKPEPKKCWGSGAATRLEAEDKPDENDETQFGRDRDY